MERRWSRRKRVERDVLVRYEGLGMLRCQTRDISFEGANIITGQFTLPPSAEIELVFVPSDEAPLTEVRLGANVVRIHDDGIGVNFSHYYDGSYNYLLRLLN